MYIEVVDNPLLSALVAKDLAGFIHNKPTAVLGLATGSTPIQVYAELVRLHKNEGLDFSRVICFNLDEYYGIPPESPQSYHYFMQKHLFDHINCNLHFIPNGHTRSIREIAKDCLQYESQIYRAGGIDIQLVGGGRTGHLGFDEPGSAFDSRTRLVALHPTTREDAVREFGRLIDVPKYAITMGLGTILEARHIIFMATGEKKARMVHDTLILPPTIEFPSTCLKTHKDVQYYLDHAAAADWQRATIEFDRPLAAGLRLQ